MSFSQPSSPNPQATAEFQQGLNFDAAKSQNQVNSYNQTTPYGSMSYASDPNSPSGYSINTSLSPAQQGLLEKQQTSQNSLGSSAEQLAALFPGMYGSPQNIDGSAVTKQLNNWKQQYVQPIFDQQSSNLEAQLHNQGLAPGTEAYNNAKNLLARNQGDVTNQYLQQNQQQGYDQAVANYTRPISIIQALMGGAAPQGPQFQKTPTATEQPANYAQLAQNDYANKQKQFENTIAGTAKLAGAFAGGWA